MHGTTQPASDPAVTRALVLADCVAGPGDAPGPLVRLLGIPLLARTVLTLQEAGLASVYVVVRGDVERARREVDRHGPFRVGLHWIDGASTPGADGSALLAAEPHLTEPFLLTTGDQVFSSGVVRSLLARETNTSGIEVAVDYRTDGRLPDHGNARVRVAADRLTAIGSGLSPFDAVATNVLVATPELFTAVREASAHSESPLASAIQTMVRRGIAKARDIGAHLWLPIAVRDDVRDAERRLLNLARKPTDGPIARYLNRPVSMAISRMLARTAVTPNGVTGANLVLGVACAILAAVGGYVPWLLSGFLFHATSVIDGVDGELAKVTYRTSRTGQWFDTLSDNATYLLFLIGLTVGCVRADLPSFYVVTGLMGFATATIFLGVAYAYLVLRGKPGSLLAVRYGYEEGSGAVARAFRLLQYLSKRDLMAFLTFLLGVAGQLPVVLPLFGILATLLVPMYLTWLALSVRRSVA